MIKTTLAAAAATGGAGEPAGGIAGWATDLMERLGAVGAGLAIALENLFPPLPSEVILPLAGFTAAQGKMSLAAALVCTTLGSVIGALALYGIGAVIGRDRVRRIAAKLPLVRPEDLDRTEAWFNRHGAKAVFFGRMIPIFRSLISVPAGVERMPITMFLLLTTLGSLIWNAVFVLAGYALGDSWQKVEEYVGVYSKAVLGVAALAVVAFIVLRVFKARKKAAKGPEGTAGAHRVRPAEETRPDVFGGQYGHGRPRQPVHGQPVHGQPVHGQQGPRQQEYDYRGT